MQAYCLQLGLSTPYLIPAGFLHLGYVPCTYWHLYLWPLVLNKECEEGRVIDVASVIKGCCSGCW